MFQRRRSASNKPPVLFVFEVEAMPHPDSAELAALLDRYERPLVRYAQSIIGDLEGARDVVQETFITFLRRGPEQPAGADGAVNHHLEGWLFTVCRNRALDQRRKQSRIIYMEQTADCTSDEPGPGLLLERKESAGSLLRLLDQLSENQRDVIRLKFQNDLSYREIAEITKLSVGNVGFLLHTGLKKLRELLSEQPGDTFEAPIRQTL
jgi:RNA polymerase sigma-70 factor (ECF subfamily)